MREHQAAAGVARDQQGKGIGAQIGFARRESPHRGTRLLGLARILTQEMPHTLHALSAGIISEWRATILVRETACLALEARLRIDQLVAGNPGELQSLGDRQLIARVKALAYGMDPASVVNRAAKAVSDRFVSCRPAPDTMTYLTGLLPVAQGVEVYATLSREADRLRAAGDARGRGQIMADTLVERITGRSEAGAVRIEVQLIMTEGSLLASSSEPAALAGYGVVPAQFARDLVRRSVGSFGEVEPGAAPLPAAGSEEARRRKVGSKQDEAAEVWLRRLYTAPSTGQLVAMDSKARLVPAGMARFIAARDQTCRMPWCGAPLRHFDHIQPHSRGGPTNADNVQGLCEACNQAKEAPGWSSSSVVPLGGTAGADGNPADARHTVETVTPTGHRYRSAAPAPPGTRSRAA
ncbi:HNH endonuclease [Arthrobacter sp. NPDC097144]|uniref:HNH endonuclease n=1 Tax=Arthrobacter sp. NPDC097144 TaxID=3363946 RepID=UPI0038208D2C